MDKKKVVVGEFDSMVEATNAFREILLKIFNRKIKRLKKKVQENEDDDFDSEEEDEVRRLGPSYSAHVCAHSEDEARQADNRTFHKSVLP